MSIQIGKNALNASQLALDTVGRNITHANDPSYARQRVHVTSTHHGNLLNRIEAAVSFSLEKDILRETSTLGYYTTQSEILNKLETSINELSDSDISSALDDFYQSLEKLSLNPHDVPLRQTVLESSQKVSDIFRLVSGSIENIEDAVDREIGDSASIVNDILSRIADQNLEIVKREGGVDDNPANELRTTRRELVNQLSQLMNVTSTELSNGSVLLQSDGRTLVFHGETRGVYVDSTDGINRLRYTGDNSYVDPSGGSLGGLISGRADIIEPMRDDLDELAREFAWQINKIHNTGRGLTGMTELTSYTKVDPNFIDESLDIAIVNQSSLGNNFKPQNGVLTIEVYNEITGSTEDFTIDITLLGDDTMSLMDLNDEIQQVDHLNASIDNVGHISIEADSGYSFFFKEDTSDVTSFLGFNNFFNGAEAGTLEVNEILLDDPQLFAAGKSASPGDNTNLMGMINTRDDELKSGFTLNQTYESYVSEVATQTGRMSSLLDNQERIVADVEMRRQTYSGVNLDEEAAALLQYQQMYGAAAQYISIQNQLFTFLMNTI
ncbi:MAG: flagellar hook-associated protein FlgK [Planctomycetes bacterium]|nr:flagellar hook-associated protein FlgK [Planctomycetota bacterium]